MIFEPKTDKQRTLVSKVKEFIHDTSEDAEFNLPHIGGKYLFFEISLVIDSMYDELNKVQDKLKEEADKNDTPITCSKGCDYCCSQPISGSLTESITISQYLLENKELKDHFFEQYKSWRSKINLKEYEKSIMKSVNDSIQYGPQNSSVENAVRSYSSEKVYCPLLMDHSCSIHPVRPVVCRHQLSLSDPELCNTEEIGLMAVSRTFDYIVNNKMSHINHYLNNTLGIKGISQSLTQISVAQLLQHGMKYVKNYANQVNQMFNAQR